MKIFLSIIISVIFFSGCSKKTAPAASAPTATEQQATEAPRQQEPPKIQRIEMTPAYREAIKIDLSKLKNFPVDTSATPQQQNQINENPLQPRPVGAPVEPVKKND
jgi:PBP1b-binding outer membrane lipoprotein LpoB